MQKVILSALLLLAAFSVSFAQKEEVMTSSGKKVILMKDGTWKYAEEQKSELTQVEVAISADKIVENKPTGSPVVHFEIGCKDLANITKFYTDNFGWSPTPIPLGSTINTNSDKGIQGHITSLGHEPFNYVSFYIEVTDIVASLKKITDTGGKKVVGPISLPDKKQFAWFKDPEGNVIGLITK